MTAAEELGVRGLWYRIKGLSVTALIKAATLISDKHKTAEVSSKGFTLVEVLISIGIIALVGAVAVPNLSKFSRTQQIRTTATEVASALKTAQSSAQSRIQCPRGGGYPSDTWSVLLTSNNFSLSAECGTASEEIVYTKPYSPENDNGTIYKGTLNVCGASPVKIIFNRNQVLYQCIGDTAFTTGQVELTLRDPSDSSNFTIIKIEEGGIIHAE